MENPTGAREQQHKQTNTTKHKKKSGAHQGARTKRAKCAVHKTITAWSNLQKSLAQRDRTRIKAATQAAVEEKENKRSRPFRNESQYGTQASDREGQAAELVQRDKEAGG